MGYQSRLSREYNRTLRLLKEIRSLTPSASAAVLPVAAPSIEPPANLPFEPNPNIGHSPQLVVRFVRRAAVADAPLPETGSTGHTAPGPPPIVPENPDRGVPVARHVSSAAVFQAVA
jgi:hypothetical protein